MKAAMHKHHVPQNYRQDLSEGVAGLTQGSSTVGEYNDKFHLLTNRAYLREDESITVEDTRIQTLHQRHHEPGSRKYNGRSIPVSSEYSKSATSPLQFHCPQALTQTPPTKPNTISNTNPSMYTPSSTKVKNTNPTWPML